MIKVLHVFNIMDRGGAETFVMNVYRKINRRKIQFGFVVHQKEKGEFDEEIYSLGGEIFYLPKYKGYNDWEYRKQVRKLLENHPEYMIVHGHMQSIAAIYLKEANKFGRITIAHSHNTSSGKGIKAMVKHVLQYPIRNIADYLFACSKEAGKWLYGCKKLENGKVEIIHNAIDVDKFAFSESEREKKREEENLDGKIVIGHVGRLTYQKNHEFLLDIFNGFCKKYDNAVLLLIGDGELKQTIKKRVEELGIQQKVRFLGVQKNVEEWMQVMDVFVFPSRYEGLPVTVVEAQASGLSCIISDTISNEVVIDHVSQVSLSSGVDEWEQAIKEAVFCNKQRELSGRIVSKTGYNIDNIVGVLEKKYEQMCSRKH